MGDAWNADRGTGDAGVALFAADCLERSRYPILVLALVEPGLRALEPVTEDRLHRVGRARHERVHVLVGVET